MSVKHQAKALIVHCIDFRFQQQIEKDLQNRGLKGQFDRIAWPGASKDLANVKKAAGLSIKLHDPDQVLIYEHKDCGAYEKDDSVQSHQANALELAKSLKEVKPQLETITMIATFDGIKKLA